MIAIENKKFIFDGDKRYSLKYVVKYLIVLIEHMVFSVIKTKTVRIIHPPRFRRQMKRRLILTPKLLPHDLFSFSGFAQHLTHHNRHTPCVCFL